MGGIGSGGVREGFGRKTVDEVPRVKISLYLPAWRLGRVLHEAEMRQLSTTYLITELLTKGLER